MTPLTESMRAAIRATVTYLRDPMREAHTDSIGSLLMMHHVAERRFNIVPVVRRALQLPENRLGALAQWGRTRSREEVAAALEALT